MEIKLDTVRTTLGVKHTLNRLKQLTWHRDMECIVSMGFLFINKTRKFTKRN